MTKREPFYLGESGLMPEAKITDDPETVRAKYKAYNDEALAIRARFAARMRTGSTLFRNWKEESDCSGAQE